MNQTITRLMQENLLAVFNERDAQRRLDVVRRNYTEDARWADAEETVVGQDRLHEKAQALLDGPLAGLSFVEAGPVHQVANMGYLGWNVFAPGSDETEPLVSGFDVAIVENDRIAQLFTVVTKEPGPSSA
ncbi:nuclear transport factor 2 family protein [Mycobacterium crocinum]|uniref:Nuclear transport factor 2 family protein n=1 Tax=Mycolicibacterium crocinum TaxID=388459 RepID=A0ABY3TMX7_9MYCO|nr:nuclear transport factor 2 family protein [Mycolicibacterium crocinum]MCV7218027.1 nuclear transport factor 2 family protein [Mycolicibacterium crocinum]ULN40520.1 nuclear transport factor 2 family protein [Mycolicibacterium crocinum]